MSWRVEDYDSEWAAITAVAGLPEVVANVWPLAIVQTCIIHLIRTSRLASRKYWPEISRDLKPIYTAVNSAG